MQEYQEHIKRNRALETSNLLLRMCGQSPEDYLMTQWLKLERLPDNGLPLPKYASTSAAGIDFSACLTRQCKLVNPGGDKRAFHILKDGGRYYADTNMPSILALRDTKNVDEFVLSVGPYETVMVPLGFKAEFGSSYVLKIHLRSSIGLAGFLLANGTGIIDPDYRGELFACIYNRTDIQLPIRHGQRIVQGVLLQFSAPAVVEGTVSETERDEGGFGSTGK